MFGFLITKNFGGFFQKRNRYFILFAPTWIMHWDTTPSGISGNRCRRSWSTCKSSCWLPCAMPDWCDSQLSWGNSSQQHSKCLWSPDVSRIFYNTVKWNNLIALRKLYKIVKNTMAILIWASKKWKSLHMTMTSLHCTQCYTEYERNLIFFNHQNE